MSAIKQTCVTVLYIGYICSLIAIGVFINLSLMKECKAAEEEYVQQTLQESLFLLCEAPIIGYKLAVILQDDLYYPAFYRETGVKGLYQAHNGIYFTAENMNMKIMCSAILLRIITVDRTLDV